MHKDSAWIVRNANLWVDNEEPLYRKKQAWVLNARRRIENATYQRGLLVPAIEKYLVPDVINKMRETGEFNDTPYEYGTLKSSLTSKIKIKRLR